MSIYSQAMGTSSDLLREETRVLGEAGSKEIKSKEFAFDKTVEYNKAAEEASQKYGNWKNTLGTIASIAAVASGVGAPMAALIAGGGTLAGGAIGKHQAKKELGGQWMQGQQSDLLKGMTKSTLTGALTSAVTAGVGAGSAKAASETAAKKAAQEALGADVKEGAVKKGLGAVKEYTGTVKQNTALSNLKGYEPGSLVDDLKLNELASDFESRKTMYTDAFGGVGDYKGEYLQAEGISSGGGSKAYQATTAAQPQDAYQNIWAPGFEGDRGKQSLMNLKFAAEGALGSYGKNPLSKQGWFK